MTAELVGVMVANLGFLAIIYKSVKSVAASDLKEEEKRRKRRGLIAIAAAGTIMVTLYIGLGIWQNSSNSGGDENLYIQETPEEYKEYYPSGELKTEGWLLNGQKSGVWYDYDSAGTNIKSVYYSEGDSIAQLDRSDLRFTILPVDSFTVFVPIQWDLKRHKDFSLMAIKRTEDSTLIPPAVTFLVPQSSQGLSLVQYVQKDTTGLSSKLKQVEKKSFRYTRIDQREAIEFIYSFERNNHHATTMITYIKDNNTIYFVTSVADSDDNQFEKHVGIFQIIVNSIDFEGVIGDYEGLIGE